MGKKEKKAIDGRHKDPKKKKTEGYEQLDGNFMGKESKYYTLIQIQYCTDLKSSPLIWHHTPTL